MAEKANNYDEIFCRSIPPIVISYTWFELKKTVENLKIMSPDSENLVTNAKSLTYIENGKTNVSTIRLIVYRSVCCSYWCIKGGRCKNSNF